MKPELEAYFKKMNILFESALIGSYINNFNFSNIGLDSVENCLKKARRILELELNLEN